MTPLTRTTALSAALLLTGGLLAVILPAVSSEAAMTTLCNSQSTSVSSGAYTVDNNEWGSGAPECISTTGEAEFKVVNSSIANGKDGAPGGYPNIYKGCFYSSCTSGSGLPIEVSTIRAGTVTTDWRTAQPGGGNIYNAAYDIWFNRSRSTGGGLANGLELMIWINHHGPKHPYGSEVASDVSIGGRTYDVFYGGRSGSYGTVTYEMTSGVSSVSNLDLRPFEANAVGRGYLSKSWWLIGVQAGFEDWQGGRGLKTESFSVTVHHRR